MEYDPERERQALAPTFDPERGLYVPGRRRFLFLGGMAALAAVLPRVLPPSPPEPEATEFIYTQIMRVPFGWTSRDMADMLAFYRPTASPLVLLKKNLAVGA